MRSNDSNSDNSTIHNDKSNSNNDSTSNSTSNSKEQPGLRGRRRRLGQALRLAQVVPDYY